MGKWIHKHSQDWRVIIDFVNSLNPNLDGIQGGLSHGRDFHVWVRQGDNNTKRFELKYTGGWTGTTAQDIETMLESGKIKLLSFNMAKPPKFWYFEEI